MTTQKKIPLGAVTDPAVAKFRALRVDGRGWAKGNLCVASGPVNGAAICESVNLVEVDPDLTRIQTDETSGLMLGLFIGVRPETLGQFTGCWEYDPLTDQNTAEIYVGDTCIVRGMGPDTAHDGREGVVCFYESAFWLDFGDEAVPVWSDSYYLEITGNIHQNQTKP